MKKFTSFTVFLFICMNTIFSQQLINLKQGEKFTIKTTMSQNADLGIGMDMKSFMATNNSYNVLETTKDQLTIIRTTTRIKIDMEMMGQQTKYDSDLKEDSASEIGKSLNQLNLPDTMKFDRNTGKQILVKKEIIKNSTNSDNPLDGLLNSFSGMDLNSMNNNFVFFIIPNGKKSGDRWQDSTITKDNRIVNTYQLISNEKNNTRVHVTTLTTIVAQLDMQGTAVSITTTATNESDLTIDKSTGIVQKNESKGTSTGNLDFMGQTMNISGTTTTSSVFEMP